MRLTKYEKETIILFNEEDDLASIFTYNMKLKSRLAKFSREHPEICRRKETNKQGGPYLSHRQVQNVNPPGGTL